MSPVTKDQSKDPCAPQSSPNSQTASVGHMHRTFFLGMLEDVSHRSLGMEGQDIITPGQVRVLGQRFTKVMRSLFLQIAPCVGP